MMPVGVTGPSVVTAPDERLMLTNSSCVRPEARTTAVPKPVATVFDVATVTDDGISKPCTVSTGTDSGSAHGLRTVVRRILNTRVDRLIDRVLRGHG